MPEPGRTSSTNHAASTEIRYEVPNALGAVWAVAPRLAVKLTRRHNYAKAVQTYLRAIDFYCEQHGVNPRRIRIDTTIGDGRIVQRISG